MSRTPQQPLPSGFGRHTPASEVIQGIDLSGRVAIVTGGYSGIGVETTRALASAGATVWVPVRDRAKAADTLADLDGDVRIADMDLQDLHSVRAFAATVNAAHDAVHILINNAGVMACPEARLGPGWESQLAINHLAHFVLTRELLPALRRGHARVVALSSSAHRISDIRWDDPHFTAEPYDKWKAYGQSKTANALFAVALDARESANGIRAFAVHPGGIQTPLQRHLPVAEMAALGWVDASGKLTPQAAAMFKSVEAGAATAVWCATSPQLDGIGGVFCEDCDIAAPAGAQPYVGVHAHAVDPASAERLWALTEAMLGDA
ncbi:MAG: oxidoreductase [Myxococcota bacterium]